jgi:hypothetical protein
MPITLPALSNIQLDQIFKEAMEDSLKDVVANYGEGLSFDDCFNVLAIRTLRQQLADMNGENESVALHGLILNLLRSRGNSDSKWHLLADRILITHAEKMMCAYIKAFAPR